MGAAASLTSQQQLWKRLNQACCSTSMSFSTNHLTLSLMRATDVLLSSHCHLLLLILLLPSSLAQRVETKQGPIIGQRTYSTDFRYNLSVAYDSFYSLPFASPPLGEDRFVRAKAAASWSEPRNATKEGAPVPADRDCYQVGGGDEDCLYLAVHVPLREDGEAEEEPLPVMVWLTGGAFLVGGGSWYGPQYWMTHKIILVTINYRLGPLGFLTLGMEEAPGNAGLWDQRAALEWVQENIAAFGGDPGRVTLAGESAGSFSAFYHLTSTPSTTGSPLFHRIIGQSGVGGLSPSYHHWSPEEGVRLGNELAVLVGCANINSHQRLDCLRNVSGWDLAKADFEDGLISMPVADAAWTSHPFFTKPPEEAFNDGDFDTSVDVLLGSNQHEGLLITQLFLAWPQLFPIMMASWQVWGPLLLLQKKPLSATHEDRANFILNSYTDGLGRNITLDHLPIVTDLMTDAFFNYGIERYVNFHLQHSHGRLFQYVDAHLNDYAQLNWANWVFGEPSSLPGVSHGDELWLQWWNLKLSQRDEAMSRLITECWANFVATGDPTPPGSDAYWEELEEEGRQYFEMEEGRGKMGRSQDWQRRADIWREALGD